MKEKKEKLDKKLIIVVQQSLYNNFKNVCEDQYKTISEAIRNFMVKYIEEYKVMYTFPELSDNSNCVIWKEDVLENGKKRWHLDYYDLIKSDLLSIRSFQVCVRINKYSFSWFHPKTGKEYKVKFVESFNPSLELTEINFKIQEV